MFTCCLDSNGLTSGGSFPDAQQKAEGNFFSGRLSQNLKGVKKKSEDTSLYLITRYHVNTWNEL